MNIETAFDRLQDVAAADPRQVRTARQRRELFRTAFEPEGDVAEVVASGSLARRTQRDPINDVDLIIVFEAEKHPDWGQPGVSADEALSYLGERVHELLGASEGTVAQEVRLARPNNHAVKCFFDDPEDENAFTVDAMPALRLPAGHLMVPEKKSETWIETDPEFLIEKVAKRHDQSGDFIELVRVLKMWNEDASAGLKSLAMEVLALKLLPVAETRGHALHRFFSAAELAIYQPIEDPSGHCGEIQPDLDRDQAKACFSEAAGHAWRACDAQDAEDDDAAACLWHKVFGDAFPEPKGGCPEDDGGTGAGALGAGVGIGITRPRPVKHAPQG